MNDMTKMTTEFLAAVPAQDRERLRTCFESDAVILWPNTNEEFDVEDYLAANCDYPGDWDGQVVLTEQTREGMVAVTRIWAVDGSMSLHVISFLRFGKTGKIAGLTEYYSDDGPVPQWRQEMNLGRKTQ